MQLRASGGLQPAVCRSIHHPCFYCCDFSREIFRLPIGTFVCNALWDWSRGVLLAVVLARETTEVIGANVLEEVLCSLDAVSFLPSVRPTLWTPMQVPFPRLCLLCQLVWRSCDFPKGWPGCDSPLLPGVSLQGPLTRPACHCRRGVYVLSLHV